jgi:molecular chaperone DnaJ
VQARLEIDLPDAALGSEKTISVDGHRSLKVKIPAGITSGKSIRLTGQGQPSPRGGPPGDLLVEISERAHPRFHRRADAPQDIEVDIPVPLDVALLGGKAEVPTLEGTNVSLTIPPQTSSGKKLRLRGKGAVIAGAAAKGTRGDLYANVSIVLPSVLTPEAKTALDKFAEALRNKT